MNKNLTLLPLCLAALLIITTAPAAAYKEDKNWPCVQAKMKKITAGTMWPGFSANEEDTSWQSNKLVKEMTSQILPRRVELAETDKIIAKFVADNADEKDKLIEQIFVALIQQTNSTRSDIIGGIGRYANRQQQLAERIKENRRKVDEFEKKDEAGTLTKEEDKEFVKIEQQLEWDIRIHEEREQSLDHVCESPVIISQRLYELSKQLQKYHSKAKKAAQN